MTILNENGTDRALQIIEDENAELKAENKRLKALIAQCDTDHAETLRKYERLNIYVAAARDVLNDADRRQSSLPGMLCAVSHLLSLGCNGTWNDYLADAVLPHLEVEDDDDYDHFDDDDYDGNYEDDPDDWY